MSDVNNGPISLFFYEDGVICLAHVTCACWKDNNPAEDGTEDDDPRHLYVWTADGAADGCELRLEEGERFMYALITYHELYFSRSS